MKEMKINECRRLLKEKQCELIRTNPHEIYRSKSNKTFALTHYPTVSPGVARKLLKFLKQI